MDASCFHIGDVVRIREWDDMVEEFDTETDDDGNEYIACTFSFVSEMRKYCGQEYTIESIMGQEVFFVNHEELLQRDDIGGWTWNISVDMIEPYQPPAAVEFDRVFDTMLV